MGGGFFSVFSFQQLLPAHQGSEVAQSWAGQAAPRSLLDSEEAERFPCTVDLAPQEGLRAGLAVRPEGWKVAVPWPVASSPGSFLRIW